MKFLKTKTKISRNKLISIIKPITENDKNKSSEDIKFILESLKDYINTSDVLISSFDYKNTNKAYKTNPISSRQLMLYQEIVYKLLDNPTNHILNILYDLQCYIENYNKKDDNMNYTELIMFDSLLSIIINATFT